ncbi:MAG: homoserine dehydrogenase [Candidatus Omnitrophica bacterium]|nr:homoserine dehydrogenase [Candidatus Omnitrophota bacterium]
MKKIGIGLIGFGTIGAGVARLLLERKKLLSERAGFIPELISVCDCDLKRPRPVSLPAGILTRETKNVLENPRVQIVLELIGGIEPAGSFLLKALQNGKSVVTANKALLAEKGDCLFSAAEQSGCHLGFEASVGGSIPIVKTLKESFIANNITSLYGILNGTTNFILTRMVEDRLSLANALKIAQDAGFAERDPSLDLSGNDSSHKLSVLATLITGKFFPAAAIPTEGISGITAKDLDYAAELGYGVKLLSILKFGQNGLSLATYPALIPNRHILSSVRDVYNAIFLTGDLVGESLLFGKGAGMDPTASSVISDIISIGNNILCGAKPLPFSITPGKKLQLQTDFKSRYYFRFSALDQPGVLARIAEILGKYNISIASCIQKEEKPQKAVPVVVLTHTAKESAVKAAISAIDRLAAIKSKTILLRLAFDE